MRGGVKPGEQSLRDGRPHFRLEMAAGGRVAGVDEVGRGPLAGPVVAAAVVFPTGVPSALASLIDDSKALSRDARWRAYRALRSFAPAAIAVGAASVHEIAALNILGATMLAMRRAISRLPFVPDLVLVDGTSVPSLPCPSKAIIGGDHTCLSIAAASIIAKVIRDRAMRRLAAHFPGYGWDENAGYATARHRAAILRLGPTAHHRMGFGTLRRVSSPD